MHKNESNQRKYSETNNELNCSHNLRISHNMAYVNNVLTQADLWYKTDVMT